MKFKATLDQLHPMMDHISDKAAAAGFDEKEVQSIQLVAEEALTNIIKYAYPESDEGNLLILCSKKKNETFEIRLEDQGPPFNPFAELQEADLETPVEDRPIGGLGLLMIQTVMDQLEYKRENDTNIVIMSKQHKVT
ncbi:Serine-protein kinase RsbW [Chlamydiales bacterium SCGC AG-110-M15]|nr:Serine-protein kinase RsbW [Chlamydiales bacterium SCGC AG-110-M15]